MTIKFICSCGKHLKARDEMAARRSVCPRCGSPVGIPSLKPTHQGTVAAPMTPEERLRHARARSQAAKGDLGFDDDFATYRSGDPAPVEFKPLNPHLVRLLTSRGVRRPTPHGRHLEKHWHQCLLYPLRAWRPCLSLALFMTAVSIGVTFLLPHLFAREGNPWALMVVRLSCVAGMVAIVGVPCGFLDCVLGSAADGEVYYIVLAGSPVTVMLRSGIKWLACFMAGPVVFAAADWLYWLKCGDPTLLDWLILTELGLVAAAYWAFALVALTDRGQLRDLNPLAVADLAHRLGWRALIVVLAAALLLLAHGRVLMDSVAEVHTDPLKGLIVLTGVWLSAMYWGTFLCRLLGVWCHRSRPTAEVRLRRRVLPEDAVEAEV